MEIRNEDGTLKAEFKKAGFWWKIEKQTENAFMVSKSMVCGVSTAAFEVFPYRWRDQRVFGDAATIPQAEKSEPAQVQWFPCDEDFGKTAWTWTDRAKADLNFEALDRQEAARKLEKSAKE